MSKSKEYFNDEIFVNSMHTVISIILYGIFGLLMVYEKKFSLFFSWSDIFFIVPLFMILFFLFSYVMHTIAKNFKERKQNLVMLIVNIIIFSIIEYFDNFIMNIILNLISFSSVMIFIFVYYGKKANETGKELTFRLLDMSIIGLVFRLRVFF